jgi:hypothetical protein
VGFKASTFSYEEISRLGDLIVTMYNQHGVQLDPTSEIARYVDSAKRLSSAWQAGDKTITRDSRQFFRILEGSMECLKIGKALQWARNKPDLQLHLKKILKGSIDPTGKQRTEAKDFWFELMVLARLEAAGIHSDLVEPPDVQFELNGSKFVVACKCAYRESNLKVQLRKATRQILKTDQKGIMAICIDALLNHSDLVIAPSQRDLYNRVMDKTERFLKQHERLLPAWINSRKVIGLLIFASTLSIIEDEKVPREGHFVLVNNRCTMNSPYFQIVRQLGSLLESAEL